MPSRTAVAVVDLDGVVADVRHRLHHLDRGASDRGKDWDAFFAEARHDDVLPEGHAVVGELASRADIVYLTGRPERLRADTLDWLTRHGLPAGKLLMRTSGDRRPAPLVKKQRLARLRREHEVIMVVDDDPAVCAAAEELGIPTLLADWMARSAVLPEAQDEDSQT